MQSPEGNEKNPTAKVSPSPKPSITVDVRISESFIPKWSLTPKSSCWDQSLLAMKNFY